MINNRKIFEENAKLTATVTIKVATLSGPLKTFISNSVLKLLVLAVDTTKKCHY